MLDITRAYVKCMHKLVVKRIIFKFLLYSLVYKMFEHMNKKLNLIWLSQPHG